jgi:hypothetical protein
VRVDAEQRRERPRDDGRARGGRALAAVARAEILDERLREEVVRRRQHQREQLRERRRGRLRELHGTGRCGGGAATAADADAVVLERRPQRARRERRGCVGAAFVPRFAAVERERRQGAFEKRVPLVVARGLAAQRVEVGLVALDRAGDVVDAVGAHELGDERGDARADAAVVAVDERGRAERGVAAAAQVQAPFPHAVGRHPPDAVDARGETRRGAHLLERGRGRVQLLDRCGRAHRRGALGEHGLLGGDVVHVRAVGAAGERELVADVGLQLREVVLRVRTLMGARERRREEGGREHAQQRQELRRGGLRH